MSVAEIPVLCPTCDKRETPTQLGRVILLKDKPYLDDGAGFILDGFIRCRTCGSAYYWQGHRMRWQDLVDNYLKRERSRYAHARQTPVG